MPRFLRSWRMTRRPAFPAAPVTTDERIPKIYNWIETHFWPKLTYGQQREMLPFFKYVKFKKCTQDMGKHWLGRQARLPNCSSMVKVLAHAIWGSCTKSPWWNDYRLMFGHLGFPEGSAPGVTLGYYISPAVQRLRDLQQAQTNSSAAKNEDNAATQNGTNVVQPAPQAISERASKRASKCRFSDETMQKVARMIGNELRQPVDVLANQIDALQRQLTSVTDRVNLATDKEDSVKKQLIQHQIEYGNKMDAMHRQLNLVVQQQMKDRKRMDAKNRHLAFIAIGTLAFWGWAQRESERNEVP